jgi:C4-dicarboxylate-specific signal transduction histidine kinase
VSEQAPGRGRLIIVDDEPVILELLASLFEGSRDVAAFTSGAEARAFMDAEGLDVLLTDKNLPDVGGLELLAHAKRVQPDCEVLLITGYASVETAVEALQLGAFDYIVKPPKSIFDVQRKVDQAFERQAMVRENVRLVEHLRRRTRELEEALEENRRVQGELIQSEKLAGIGTLAAGIAHEISSPLFGVLGLAEAILDEDDLGTVRRHAREIVEYAGAIKEIVVGLSGYSRTAESEYRTTVDLAATLGDATRLVARSLGLPDTMIAVDVPQGLYVQARTGEIQQIFVNLVKNAVDAVQERHGDGHGHVRVAGERGHGEVILRVSDDGPGIPEEARRNLFDPFYTTKAPGKGTGLGLNIVYRLVTRYRGTIAVDGQVGEGATFTVRFPVDEARADDGAA